MGNFSRLLNYRLDHGNVSHGTDWSKDGGGSSVGQTSVGQNGSIKQHLGVSFSLLPLSNDCFFSSSWSSKDGETMVGQGGGSVTSVGGGVGSVTSVGDGVGSHLVTHLGGSQHVRLHLGRMSHGTHWGQDGGGSGVGQTSSTQQLGVSL